MDWRVKVKDVLADRNITQAELARRMGLSRATVSIILTGKESKKEHTELRYRRQFADALGVNAAMFDGKPSLSAIPLFTDPDPAYRFIKTGTLTVGEFTWHSENYGGHFGYQYQGAELNDLCRQGDTLIISADRYAQIGEIAMFRVQDEVIVGKYHHQQGQRHLSFDVDLPAIEVDKDSFIGVVVFLLRQIKLDAHEWQVRRSREVLSKKVETGEMKTNSHSAIKNKFQAKRKPV